MREADANETSDSQFCARRNSGGGLPVGNTIVRSFFFL